jgi:IS1 family transposase
MTIEFGQRIADLLGDLMSTPQPIEVKIFGDNYNVFAATGRQGGTVDETGTGRGGHR